MIYRLIFLGIVILISACQTPCPQQAVCPTPEPKPKVQKASYRLYDYSSLPNWNQDDVSQAWPAFLTTCKALNNKPGWQDVCAIAKNVDGLKLDAVRQFFEIYFDPYQLINPDQSETGLITGYYEPLLQGARERGGKYQVPLYNPPADLLTIDMTSIYPELKGMRLRGRLKDNKVIPYYTRAELQSEELEGLEICWVDDPVDAFFLQVQGSGRVFLNDTKETIRVAFADQNGYPYKSIGRYLIDQGELTLDRASAQGIKNWIAQHPKRKDEVLNANPSYIFFKEEKIADPYIGPKGALGVPLSEERSLAIDPTFIPLGVPVFINTTEPNSNKPLNRLMMAQDTGGAIRGAVRADFFWGFGKQAGDKAGRMKQQGSIWLLWPKQIKPPFNITGSTQ